MIANKYSIVDWIGQGQFGEVYRGQVNREQVNRGQLNREQLNREQVYRGQEEGDKQWVAIKIEKKRDIQLLKRETTTLDYLYRKGCRGIPTVYWYGMYQSYPTLVMTYFDMPLHADIFSPIVFSTMISIIEHIHIHGMIHRDIKPSNFMLKGGHIHLIDFGFATFYVNEHFQHKPDTLRSYITGTPPYISWHIHNGHEPSRRDDLISLGYIYLFLVNPIVVQEETIDVSEPLSPMDILYPTNLKWRETKSWTHLSNHLSPSSAIYNYLQRCYQMSYNETPCYSKLRELFK
jgi:serine/threonine protein kinase